MKTCLPLLLAGLLLGSSPGMAQVKNPIVKVSPTAASVCNNQDVIFTATASQPGFTAGSALQFDGANDYATVPATASLDITSAITVETWLNPALTGGSNAQSVLAKADASQNSGFIFPRTTDNWLSLLFSVQVGGSWRTVGIPYSQFRGGWHHLAASYDGQRVKLFVDGRKALDQALTGELTTNTLPLSVGTLPGKGEFFKGEADEIRIWNVARPETDLVRYYGQPVPASAAGLVAYYKLDEATGSTLASTSPNKLPGALAAGDAAPAWLPSTSPMQPAFRYSWTPTDGLNRSDVAQVKAKPEQSTTYRVRVTNYETGLYAEATALVEANRNGANVWKGTVSSDWLDPANWRCGSVPQFGIDVVIPAGVPHTPIYRGSTNGVGNLTIEPGAKLTMMGTATTVLGIRDNFRNDGTFDMQAGEIMIGGNHEFGGTSLTVVKDLKVIGAGARLTGPVKVQGLLTLGATLDLNGQQLTLISTPTSTASVYVNGVGEVKGAVNLQRYISGTYNSGVGYHHLSSPVSGATVSQLQVAGGSAPIVNPAYNTAANPAAVTPFPTVLTYEESRLTGGDASSFEDGWMSPQSLNTLLQAGKCYSTFTKPGLLTYHGTLNNGAYPIQLQRGAAGQGWNLIGNPYPSPLNWDLVQLPTGVDAAAYIYHSTGKYSGQYVAYVNRVGAPRAHLISMGQGFFVRATTGTPTLTLQNYYRETTLQPNVMYRKAETRPMLALGLISADSAATAEADDVFYVYRQEGATVGFDGKFDAFKLQPGRMSLYQVNAANETIAIQGLPNDTKAQQLALAVQVPVAGRYTLRPEEQLNFPSDDELWLEDKQSGYWHNLRSGSLTVELPQGATTGRFVLHVGQRAVLATRPTKATGAFQLYPNPTAGGTVQMEVYGVRPGNITLCLLNSLGQVVQQQRLAAPQGQVRQALQLPAVAAGVYTVQLRTADGVLSHKLIIR